MDKSENPQRTRHLIHEDRDTVRSVYVRKPRSVVGCSGTLLAYGTYGETLSEHPKNVDTINHPPTDRMSERNDKDVGNECLDERDRRVTQGCPGAGRALPA